MLPLPQEDDFKVFNRHPVRALHTFAQVPAWARLESSVGPLQVAGRVLVNSIVIVVSSLVLVKSAASMGRWYI
jgi:hypothetical protein